jgi:hypothetical protein
VLDTSTSFGPAMGLTRAPMCTPIPPLPPPDLAYAIVRIVESFVYADIITGERLDIAKAEQPIAASLVSD